MYQFMKTKDRRFYSMFSNMHARCKNKIFKHHNGNNIIVCDRWKVFENFRYDMYTSYQKHIQKYGIKDTTLDRINNNDNYSPENCRWATRFQQRINQKNVHIIFYNGEYKTIKELSLLFDIKYKTLWNRINRYNWSIKRSLEVN